MHEYFTKLVEECQKKLDEVLAFFKGHMRIEPPSFDDKTKSYLCQDGIDPDFLIDSILNGEMGATEGGALDMKEGSLTKRSDGRWMGRYYENGIQRCVYARTKEECEKKVKEAIKQRDLMEKASVTTKRFKLIDWAREWFDGKKVRLRPSSIANIDYTFIRPIERHPIGQKEVGKLTALDVDKFLNSISTKPARARCFVNLNECLEKLYKTHVLRENPCAFVDRPKRPKAKAKLVPETDDLDAFFAWLDQRNKEVSLFSRFVANTGLRMGEALALEWRDIDEEHQRMHIDKAYDQTTSKVSTVKTMSSIRDVPLIPGAWRVIQTLDRKEKTLFHFIGARAISGRFRKFALEYGLVGLNLHGLRHYFATVCHEAGIDKKIVQMWLGHSKYDVTVNTYTHIRRKFEELEIRKMTEFTRKKGDEFDT